MKLATTILVTLVSTSSCNLENIDHAQPTFTAMESLDQCKDLVAVVDPKPNIRAFCWDGVSATLKDTTND